MIREAAFRAKTALAGRASLDTYEEFRAMDALSPGEITAVGEERSSAQARFAFAHSDFYRDLYSAHGFTADDLRDPDAFGALPIVDKAMLREGFDRIRTVEATPRTSAVSKTGGSTGLPLHLLRDLRFRRGRWSGGCSTGGASSPGRTAASSPVTCSPARRACGTISAGSRRDACNSTPSRSPTRP